MVTESEKVEAELICGVVNTVCTCGLEPNHETPYHACINKETCGGEWNDAITGGVFPKGMGMDSIFSGQPFGDYPGAVF